MNQKVAKRIRKIIYADNSQRTRDYGVLQLPKRRGMITGQLICRGLRERCQSAKKFYKAARRAGRPLPWIWWALETEGKQLHSANSIEKMNAFKTSSI